MPSNKPLPWVRIGFGIVLAVIGVAFILYAGEVIKLLVISTLFAYIADPLVVFLESRGLSRSSATTVLFLTFFVVLGILIAILLPVFQVEISSVQHGLSSGQAGDMLNRVENMIDERLPFLGIRNMDLGQKIDRTITSVGEWIFEHILDVVALATNLVIIPFMVFFFLKDGRRIKKKLIELVPNRYFEFSMNLLYKMDLQLGNYLRGQFLDALIFGTMSVFALWLIGAKYFLLIGIFAGFANLIPFLGPIAGAAPAIVISVLYTGDFSMAVYIIIAFAIMKLIDDTLVQPIVVARSVDMHPLMVLLAVIVGGKIFGILGMLVAVPVTGFIKVVLNEGIINARRYRLT